MNKILILTLIFLLIIPNFYNSSSLDINNNSKSGINRIQSSDNMIVTKNTFDIANDSIQLHNLNIPASSSYPLTIYDSAILSQNHDLLLYYSNDVNSDHQNLVIRNETSNQTQYIDVLSKISIIGCTTGCSWGNSWIPNMFEINNVVYFSGQDGFIAYNETDHSFNSLTPPHIADFRISSMIPDPNNQVIYMVGINALKNFNEPFFEIYNISSKQFTNISIENQSYFWSVSLPTMTINRQDNSVYFLLLNSTNKYQIYRYSIQNKTVQHINLYNYSPYVATIFFDNHSSHYFYQNNVYDENFTLISQLHLPHCFEQLKIDHGSSLFCISSSGTINVINTDTFQTRPIYKTSNRLGHVFYDKKRYQMLIIEPNSLYSIDLTPFKTDLFSPLVNYTIENNTISLNIFDNSQGSFTVYENSINISDGLIYSGLDSQDNIQFSQASKNITVFAKDNNGYWTQLQFLFGSSNIVSHSSTITSQSITFSDTTPSFEFLLAIMSLLVVIPIKLRKRRW